MVQIKQVVKVSGNIQEFICKVCGGSVADWDSDFVVGATNHYLGHGFKILHVGQETDRVDEGLWQSTVVVLGK